MNFNNLQSKPVFTALGFCVGAIFTFLAKFCCTCGNKSEDSGNQNQDGDDFHADCSGSPKVASMFVKALLVAGVVVSVSVVTAVTITYRESDKHTTVTITTVTTSDHLTPNNCEGHVSVVLGGHDLLEYKGSEQKLEVEAVYVNKNYSLSGDLQGDIALVKLRYII